MKGSLLIAFCVYFLLFGESFTAKCSEHSSDIFPLCNECGFSYRNLCKCISHKKVYLAIVSPDFKNIDSSFGHVFLVFSQSSHNFSQATAVSWSNVEERFGKFKGFLYINTFAFLKKQYVNRRITFIRLNLKKGDRQILCRKIWELRQTQANYNPVSFNCASFISFLLKGTSLESSLRKHLIFTPISLYKDLKSQNVPWHLGSKLDLGYNFVSLTSVFSGQLENHISFLKPLPEESGFLEIFKLSMKDGKMERFSFLNNLRIEDGKLYHYQFLFSRKYKFGCQIERGITLNKFGTISLNFMFFPRNIIFQPYFIFRRTFNRSGLIKVNIGKYINIKLYVSNIIFEINNLSKHNFAKHIEFGVVKTMEF